MCSLWERAVAAFLESMAMLVPLQLYARLLLLLICVTMAPRSPSYGPGHTHRALYKQQKAVPATKSFPSDIRQETTGRYSWVGAVPAYSESALRSGLVLTRAQGRSAPVFEMPVCATPGREKSPVRVPNILPIVGQLMGFSVGLRKGSCIMYMLLGWPIGLTSKRLRHHVAIRICSKVLSSP